VPDFQQLAWLKAARGLPAQGLGELELKRK